MGKYKKEVKTEKQQEEIFEFDDDLTNNYVSSTKKFEQNIQTPMKLNGFISHIFGTYQIILKKKCLMILFQKVF